MKQSWENCIFHIKQNVSSKSDYNNYSQIDEKHWLIACKASCKRASLLVKYSSNCTYDYFIHNLNQEEIYFYQKRNYICNGHFLCVLNSLPLFLRVIKDRGKNRRDEKRRR